MKRSAPQVVRSGSLIRVGGGPDAPGPALALSFVDLRFIDGHIERWLGPGRIGSFSGDSERIEALVAWGHEVIEDEAESLTDELRMSFTDVPASLACPVEVVIEWNADLDLPGHPPWRFGATREVTDP